MIYFVDKGGYVSGYSFIWESLLLVYATLSPVAIPAVLASMAIVGASQLPPLSGASPTVQYLITSAVSVCVLSAFTLVLLCASSLVSHLSIRRVGPLFPLPPPLTKLIDPVLSGLQRATGGLASRPLIVWCPRDLTAGARLIGLARPKIVISGGLGVMAGRHPNVVRAIVAHELGHVANHDRVVNIYLLFAALFIAPGSLMLVIEGFIGAGLMLAGQTVFGVIYLYWRRELMADASAVNLCEDRVAYTTILKGGFNESSLPGFHPDDRSREDAIETGTTVSARSRLFLCYCALAIGGIVFSPILPFLMPALLIVPCGALFSELKKGRTRLRPATRPEIALALRLQPDLRPLSLRRPF